MKNKEKKFSVKYIAVAYSVPLVLQLAFFIYQISNMVISFWNIFSTIMIVYLFVFAIRGACKENNDTTKKDNTSKNVSHEKLSKKAKMIFSLIAVVFVGIAFLFFGIYTNKSKGFQIVNSKVVSQEGETFRDTSVSSDGVSTTESDYIEVEVEYMFNGKVKNAIITATNTDKIYVDNLKIYIDQNGEFICDYGRVVVCVFFLYIIILFKK